MSGVREIRDKTNTYARSLHVAVIYRIVIGHTTITNLCWNTHNDIRSLTVVLFSNLRNGVQSWKLWHRPGRTNATGATTTTGPATHPHSATSARTNTSVPVSSGSQSWQVKQLDHIRLRRGEQIPQYWWVVVHTPTGPATPPHSVMSARTNTSVPVSSGSQPRQVQQLPHIRLRRREQIPQYRWVVVHNPDRSSNSSTFGYVGENKYLSTGE